MKQEIYQRVVERLQKIYALHDIALFERHGVRYPLSVIPAKNETVDDILSLAAPRANLTRAELPIYDESIIEQTRKNGGTLYNGVTFAFDKLETNPLRLHAKLGTYFDHMATCIALEHELVSETMGQLWHDLTQHISPKDLMLSGAGRSAAIGVNTLIVFKTNDGYRALFTQRSNKTAHKPGAFHVIPAFTFQPTAENYPAQEWNLRHHIMREYVEELFDADEIEHGGNAEDHPAWEELETLMETGQAALHLTGITMNLMTTHVSVCTLLLIHDADWYPALDRARITTWETHQRFVLPIASDDAILNALPANAYRNMSPNGASTLWLGIDRARILLQLP